VPRLTPAPEEPSAVAGALGDTGWSELDLPVLGTLAHLAVRGGGPGLLIDARQLLEEYDRRWNPARPESLVAQLEAGDGPVPVDDTFRLVAASVAAAEATAGALGSEGLELNEVLTRVTAPDGSVVDLDDLARATVADRVAEALVEAGAAGAAVDVAGALRLAGTVAEGSAWVVEVFDEDGGEDDAPRARLGIAEGAAVTVHRPTADLASVTVLADDAATAMVFAAAGDVALVDGSGLPALVVADDGTTTALGGVDAFVRA
jgi:thiamine biosynthesis lipoprotein